MPDPVVVPTRRGQSSTSTSSTFRPDVQAALDEFRRSPLGGVWPHIDKTQLVDDVARTIRRPTEVAQAGTAFCGPAAVTYEFVRYRPRSYVVTCRQLFERGQVNLPGGETVRPSSTLRNSPIATGISAADWMLMAALRESQNMFFDVAADSGAIAQGLTTPGEMKGWARELLLGTGVGYDSTYISGELAALKKADAIVRKGGVAFLMINTGLVQHHEGPYSRPPYPEHWVSYAGNLNLARQGHVSFVCYTWGNLATVATSVDALQHQMWGLVYATAIDREGQPVGRPGVVIVRDQRG